ncbi:MAG: NAD-dependent epimerase/dehydratase family protein [Desulfobacteraceae bacterium]|jgi:UDP-glucose 4-epimerase|nr:MAG: NAD-dependent epimerase/dehydratase family protein [Desulfobacteraceae bacterium]
MRVAVTGVSGYLGRLIARSMDADPEVESILGLDIVEPKTLPHKMAFQKTDVRDADFAGLFRGVDVVYHLAFIVEPPKMISMAEIDEINIQGSRRVFEGAIAAGVPKIVYSSSVAAYGAHADNPVPLLEDSPLRPNSDWYYSRAKGAVEGFLDDLQGQNPATVIIRFRPCMFLGPTISNSARKALSGRVLLCIHEDTKIDLAWDEDIADAFHMALGYKSSDIFNLAGEGPLTTMEMGALINKRVLVLKPWWLIPACRFAVKLGLVSRGQMEWLQASLNYPLIVSAEKARKKLGWKPRFNAGQALVRFVKNN